MGKLGAIKVGTRLKCINADGVLVNGAIYTVASTFGSENYVVLKEVDGGWSSRRFEVVATTPDEAGNVKAGTRLKCIDADEGGPLVNGATYTVAVDRNDGLVLLNEVNGSWNLNRFEVVKPETSESSGVKVGTRLKCINTDEGAPLVVGATYTVASIFGSDNFVTLNEVPGQWSLTRFVSAGPEASGEAPPPVAQPKMTPEEIRAAFHLLNDYDSALKTRKALARAKKVEGVATIMFSEHDERQYPLTHQDIINIINRDLGAAADRCHAAGIDLADYGEK